MAEALQQKMSDGRLEIQTTTKESGSWAQYIEVGETSTDAFGDQVFQRRGYAQKIKGIEVLRKFEGTGAARYCRWIIRIDPNFTFMVRRVTNPGGAQRDRIYDILYVPKEGLAL